MFKELNTPMFHLEVSQACLGRCDTKEQRESIKNLNGKWKPAIFSLEGNIEELIKKSHISLIGLLARVVTEHEDNKHLNLDMGEVGKYLKNKYTIQIN